MYGMTSEDAVLKWPIDFLVRSSDDLTATSIRMRQFNLLRFSGQI